MSVATHPLNRSKDSETSYKSYDAFILFLHLMAQHSFLNGKMLHNTDRQIVGFSSQKQFILSLIDLYLPCYFLNLSL